MTLIELIEDAKSKAGDEWDKLQIEIPDEFNGGWHTLSEENVVVDDGLLILDFWKSRPDEEG